MSNHLKDQSSPYLLQHAENPVNWYPWTQEAFDKAIRENKPVFLSIGYSTCHWCHVMERESFENQRIAGILNQSFISIKVDREERPDIDSVYMAACQVMTGSGGWPMSLFLTPEKKPFFAGTYFPPASKNGMPGFDDILLSIADLWKNKQKDVLDTAQDILSHLQELENPSASREKHEKAGASYREQKNADIFHRKQEKAGISHPEIDVHLPEKAARSLFKSFDRQYGGFGSAPKFPTPHNLLFLMLYSRINTTPNILEQAFFTLEQMRRGGIFDHIGFGFSRYSTDKYFLVPHFEKMLYDNALLILAYCAAYKISGNEVFLDTAKKAAAYVLRDLTGRKGEFFSAQDADSDGEEGKFYLWKEEEIYRFLGQERGRRFCTHFGITKQGNFEGKNIPNLLHGSEILDNFEGEKELLHAYRKTHFPLHLDDKILTSWNALMICALTVLYRVTGDPGYLSSAQKAQRYIEKNLAYGNTLYVSFRKHIRFVKGFLDEYAYYAAALLQLYEATGNHDYLERAKQICGEASRQFSDENNGGYFLYGLENESLIARPKETYDGALPSGNSVMAYCLLRLSQITGEDDYEQMFLRQLHFLSVQASHYPAGHSFFLLTLLMHLHPMPTVTVVLSDTDRKEDILKDLPLYADIRILKEETGEYPLLNGKTTYYACKGHICLPPSNRYPG